MERIKGETMTRKTILWTKVGDYEVASFEENIHKRSFRALVAHLQKMPNKSFRRGKRIYSLSLNGVEREPE